LTGRLDLLGTVYTQINFCLRWVWPKWNRAEYQWKYYFHFKAVEM